MEAAIVLPVFFLLMLAIFEFGLVYSAYHTMVGATRRAARYAAAPDPTVADATYYYAPPTFGEVAYKVCQQLQAGVFGSMVSLDKSVPGGLSCSSYPAAMPNSTATCPTWAGGSVPALAADDIYVNICTMPSGPFDNSGRQAGSEKYVQVAVRRTVTLLFGWQIPLSTRAFMRMENN